MGRTSGRVKRCVLSALLAAIGITAVPRFASAAPENAVVVTVPVAASKANRHACAIRRDFAVWCWGSNEKGQLGYGGRTGGETNETVLVPPQRVVGIDDAIAVAAGMESTCAVRASGQVWCWGDNADGQLGNGTFTDTNIPVQTVGITDAIAVSVGDYRTCALRQWGSVLCWGRATLGDASTTSPGSTRSATPVGVTGLHDAISVSANRNGLSCAVRRSGQVVCWGGFELIGRTVRPNGIQPIAVPSGNITHAASVNVGTTHICTVNTDATVACWGNNESGQLGNTRNAQLLYPDAQTVNLPAAETVGAGGYSTCALTVDRNVWCWGGNGQGQLGVVTTPNPGGSAQPVQVPVSNVVALDVGATFSCVVKTDRAVTCWGFGAGFDAGLPDFSTVLTDAALPGDVVIPASNPTGRCSVLVATGGPWSNVYNQTLTLTASDTSVTRVKVTVNLPAGHTITSGWNPPTPASNTSTLIFEAPVSRNGNPGTGLNLTIAASADPNARPTYRCVLITTTTPPTSPPAVCVVTATTGGPWGAIYNQTLKVTANIAGLSRVRVTVSFPAGHTQAATWNPSLPESNTSSVTFDAPVSLNGNPGTGLNVQMSPTADPTARPTYTCQQIPTTNG
jgi:alpha-tubulin suppressor-like RCC1 family protein